MPTWGIDYQSLDRSRHSLLVGNSVLLYARTPHRYCRTTSFLVVGFVRLRSKMFFYARIKALTDQLFSLQVYSGDDNGSILNLLTIDLMFARLLQ